ncbi:fimbria/pilus outer membrane usher protein, partial [Pseudomonas syringae pv. tagetis]|uniref:fimbria/pilus outer membrane usher protein n=1 Tax=Pseudomonas syringae group genomosp. 7 TaxID=251699 RepID=UPI00377065ED
GKISTTSGFGRFEDGNSQGQDYDAFSLSAAGSLVAHAGGLNLGQALRETFALIQVPDVSGARLRSFSNVEKAGNGEEILP